MNVTLEIKTHLPPKGCGLGVSDVDVVDDAVNPQEKLVTVVVKLIVRVEILVQGQVPTNER